MTHLNHQTFNFPQIMGILNVTPDSFSDGGQYIHGSTALKQVERMIEQGANIIDIGGESTRPGAADVPVDVEINRVIPVLKSIKAHFDIKVSIDTSKAQVMSKAIDNNADIINDVRALQNKGCLEIVSQSEIPVCLMHMQGNPSTMQVSPNYNDICAEIKTFFNARIEACEKAGINKERIIIDPGFGFGKTMEQNYHLLANLERFKSFGLPVLSGTSRKSMIGNLLNCEVNERLAGSLSTALVAAQQGANIIRVHDVKETVDALKVLQAVAVNR